MHTARQSLFVLIVIQAGESSFNLSSALRSCSNKHIDIAVRLYFSLVLPSLQIGIDWPTPNSSAVARVSEAPPEISRGAPHTLLAYYCELQ